MDYLDKEQVKYVEEQKEESSKCRNVWQEIIRKTLGCTKEQIQKYVASCRREKERVISILYGSVFQGERYLAYTKKWRGNTLNEIINQDERNYANLKKLGTADNSYLCRLALGYVDQDGTDIFGQNGQAELNNCEHEGNGDGDANNHAEANANGNTTTITDNITVSNNNNSNGPTTHSNMVTRGKAHHAENNAPLNENDGMFEKLNYLEKRNYRNKSKVGYYNGLHDGTTNSHYYYSNEYGNGRDDFHSAGNYYSVGGRNVANSRRATGRNARTSNPNGDPSCEFPSEQNDAIIKYKYLPTGVFYSRVSRSFIANWIDHKTRKQIKVPYKIAEFGIEKSMILAILSRNHRINKLQKALQCYDSLTTEQKEEMLQDIRTTQKSENLFHDLLKPSGRGTPNGGDIPNGRGMSNGKEMPNGGVTPNGRGTPNVLLHSRAFPNGATDRQIHNVNIQMDQPIGHVDQLIGPPNQLIGQSNQPISQPNQLPSLSSNNNSPKNRDQRKPKRTTIKKKSVEKKKIKQSYHNAENLPTGVYFYQGSYVANWWETQQKKQFKVPFKISEHGITKAKNLAIISRIIRSSSVQEVNFILSQMEQTMDITKFDYATMAALASKYILTKAPREE
ncbi:Uncharacterized protein PCOAH_00040780 [Plasmodium coatneyi]|uniref:Transcription factor with AP2 domain(S) n=1 Tax=Plasmodium coatneyi TaxID=208452 RepID=A0A1B1E5U9_9APIC|nr:Uncharacterized protein PCOAH_00040780 [Plasmodium coatneyi]ANQ10330.1 Uncharacterized protein PCOAH_00040780 [Plasmodium coatneyi]